MITQQRLKEALKYDEQTGIFTWKITSGRCAPGYVAGSPNGNGYPSIKVDGHLYLAHRLAWLYVFGSFPSKFIDHIDGNRSNNAMSNLRESTYFENAQNIHQKRKTESGLIGAHWDKTEQKYRSAIMANGKRKALGMFKTAEEANSAYLAAKKVLHPFCYSVSS